jgi:hypothetical protein
MKRRIAATLMLAMLAGSPAVGQSPPPTAGTAAPGAAPSQAPARAPAEANRARASNVDARNCLGFSTNLEVIKCAEKYLYRRPKG